MALRLYLRSTSPVFQEALKPVVDTSDLNVTNRVVDENVNELLTDWPDIFCSSWDFNEHSASEQL
jgi:galactitol-specific phosphotransferase system IIB component